MFSTKVDSVCVHMFFTLFTRNKSVFIHAQKEEGGIVKIQSSFIAFNAVPLRHLSGFFRKIVDQAEILHPVLIQT